MESIADLRRVGPVAGARSDRPRSDNRTLVLLVAAVLLVIVVNNNWRESESTPTRTTSAASVSERSGNDDFEAFLVQRLSRTSYAVTGSGDLVVIEFSVRQACNELQGGTPESTVRNNLTEAERFDPELDDEIPIFVNAVFDAIDRSGCR